MKRAMVESAREVCDSVKWEGGKNAKNVLWNDELGKRRVLAASDEETKERGGPIGRAEVEVRKGKFKNGKASGKDEITGEMIKGGVTGWWIGSGGHIIWPLRVVLCLKIGDPL